MQYCLANISFSLSSPLASDPFFSSYVSAFAFYCIVNDALLDPWKFALDIKQLETAVS